MRILLTLGLIAASFVAWPNIPEEQWSKGSIVLSDQEVLTGEFHIQPMHNIVLQRCDGRIKVYPAHKFKTLYIYDANANINRKYISEPVMSKGFTAHRIYEIVLRGKLTVIRQPKELLTSVLHDAYDYNYYIVINDEKVSLKNFYRKVYPLLLRKDPNMIASYVKKNKLCLHRSADALKIIDFYNKKTSMQIGEFTSTVSN